MTRDFDLSDVLSITDGHLVSSRHMDGVYDILNFMTGDNLFTHALVRAAETCKPVLLAQHPQLADVVFPVREFERWKFDHCNDHRDHDRPLIDRWMREWMAGVKATLGVETLPVAPLDDWHSMDPLQELAEMTETPDRIIAVYQD